MAFDAFATSAILTVDDDFEFFTDGTDAIVLQLTPRETGKLNFVVDAAGTTDDLEIEVLQGHRISTGNALDGATGADDLELDTAADGFTTDDDMNGKFIVMTSGDEQGEGKLIVDSAAADDGVNLENALSGTPSAAEGYDLYQADAQRFTMDPQTTITDDAQNNAGIAISAVNGEFVLVRARADGGTDAHRVTLTYQLDAVSI
jgi:hypothetical protein